MYLKENVKMNAQATLKLTLTTTIRMKLGNYNVLLLIDQNGNINECMHIITGQNLACISPKSLHTMNLSAIKIVHQIMLLSDAVILHITTACFWLT